MQYSHWKWVAKKTCALIAAVTTAVILIYYGPPSEYGFYAVGAMFFVALWSAEFIFDLLTGNDPE